MANKHRAILFFILFLSACSPAPLTQATSTSPEVLSSSTKTIEPGASATVIHPTRTATLTPFPTLLEGDKLDYINQLFETNGDCQLPCWWGITPGITTWNQTEAFLDSISTNMVEATSPLGNFKQFVVVNVSEEISATTNFTIEFRIDQQGTIERIRTIDFWDSELFGFSISEILRKYGEPDQVYVNADPITMDNTPRFKIILFYPDYGIMFGKTGIGKIIGQDMEICPAQHLSSNLYLWMWNSNESLEFIEVDDGGIVNPSPTLDLQYIELKESSNMDKVTFSQEYIDPGSSACFETPLVIWSR